MVDEKEVAIVQVLVLGASGFLGSSLLTTVFREL
jgi:nucleoside-diphosphate-sugar epimerase